MSVSAFIAGDLFTIRVVKHLNTNPADQWANAYEFQATEAGTEAQLLALGVALVAFEAALHHTTTLFDRLLISTWEPDSVPYDPTAFISTTLSDVGDRGALSDPLSLNQCLSVTRVCATGRFGHLFYRNCVAEAQVGAPAGKTTLNDRSAFQGIVDDALAASNLDGYIGITPDEALRMAMVSADGTQKRPVVGLIVQGMTTIKTDHKWFNRTSPA
jgi:hypothetical protein